MSFLGFSFVEVGKWQGNLSTLESNRKRRGLSGKIVLNLLDL